jgi:hypothetical protein
MGTEDDDERTEEDAKRTDRMVRGQKKISIWEEKRMVR